MSTALNQPATNLELWERFQAGRCSDQEIAGSLVLQRWLRCQRAGLSADNPGEPVMALAGLSETIDRFAPVLAPGAPFDAFAMAMARAGFCGVFCDSNGLVISRRIAEPFESSIAETRLVEGALWSEMARGTNGVGTSIVECAAVAIVGVDHFELRNHRLACYAAPVRDIRERVVAVLDATGPASSAAGFVLASVVATAAAIEALIVARTYDAAVPGGLFELERLIARLPHATLVVEATGHMRRANDRFRALLPMPRQSEFAHVVSANLGANPGSRSARLENLSASLRGFEIEFEPIGQPDDPFAALVHLRPHHWRQRAVGSGGSVPEAFAPIVGSDPALVAARTQAARFARTDIPILLLGETGAGKEIFARAIHDGSARRHESFVAVNCGAIAATLLESELFGYAPGAFTGSAPAGRTGKLAAAHGGTLFLDEVGELSPPTQATLLRFLEDGTFYRVGEATERRADVRLIAATSRDLPTLVTEGRFRSDLYFRMRGAVLRLPPLRDRNDRGELTEALLARIARSHWLPKPLAVSRAALAWIERYDWPGNVRELLSALNYSVVLAGDAPRIELWHLPIEEAGEPSGRQDLRAVAERAAVLHALNHSRGNLSDAARSLGVARSTLYRMLARHDIRPAAGSGET